MDYDKIIDLDRVTLEDCIQLYTMKNKVIVINDGHILNIEEG